MSEDRVMKLLRCDDCGYTIDDCDQCEALFEPHQEILCVDTGYGAIDEFKHFCDESCHSSWWLPNDATVVEDND